ncbi:MAG: PulJ/GspJ family protein [Gemmatimonadota bacterium]
MRSVRVRRGRGGFTLLEVIVALAITGLLVAAVYAAVDAASDAQERNRAVQEEARRQRNAWMVLSALLRSARVDPAVADPEFRGADTAGGAELRFVSALGVPLLGYAAGETVRVSLKVEPGQGLLLTLADAWRPAPTARGLVLLPRVEAIEARYREPESGVWQETWGQPAGLPDAVAIAFVSPTPLPTLLVELPVRVAPGPARGPPRVGDRTGDFPARAP